MADEMTLEGLAGEMRSLMGELRRDVTAEIGGLRQEMQTEIGSLRQEMKTGFARVDRRFDDERRLTKIEFEETQRMLRLAYEAQGGMRESIDAQFEESKREADERYDLLCRVAENFGVRTARLERRRPQERPATKHTKSAKGTKS